MRVPKPVVYTTISIVSLLVVFVGGGVAYTWYMGQQVPESPAAIAAPVEARTAPVIKPVKPAANAPVSASVQNLTSPVAPGANASLTIRTRPEAKCNITVEYDKVASTDSGLSAKVADDFGMVSWTWTVEDTAAIGKWPVKVLCVYKDKSAAVQADLEVKPQS